MEKGYFDRIRIGQQPEIRQVGTLNIQFTSDRAKQRTRRTLELYTLILFEVPYKRPSAI